MMRGGGVRIWPVVGIALHLFSCGASSAYAAPLSLWDELLFARGINLSSAALGDTHIPGIYGRDYIYPSSDYLDYYASKGFGIVRLPFLWERLQQSLFGPLDPGELQRIKNFVDAARTRKIRVILSPHNFGRYHIDGRETLIGTPGLPIEAFADFSFKVASTFAGDGAVYGLSLMNEPHDSQGMWKRTAQAGLDAIRRADRTRLVLAPGDQWSEAYRWRQYNDDFVLNDPESRIMYEAHQYFDADHTGSYKLNYTLSGATPDRGVAWVQPFVNWLHQHQLPGILTEFGVPNNDARWFGLMEELLSYLARERVPWTYWAGGPWWGEYRLSTEPKNGTDAPIMAILTKDYGTVSYKR